MTQHEHEQAIATAIQSAIDDGYTVALPRGDYFVRVKPMALHVMSGVRERGAAWRDEDTKEHVRQS